METITFKFINAKPGIVEYLKDMTKQFALQRGDGDIKLLNETTFDFEKLWNDHKYKEHLINAIAANYALFCALHANSNQN